jgi:hypothetical protein
MVSGTWQAVIIGLIASLLVVIPADTAKADESTPGICQQAYGSLDSSSTLPDSLQTEVETDDLHTDKRYDLLAGHLLFSGFVDGSQCAGWGLNGDGSPNGCGVAISETAVTEWQNQFDEAIINASQALQLSPRLLKAVIAVETQFWPGSDWGKGEIGLGQLTDAGADMVLTWRPGVYQNTCSQVYTNETCQSAYVDLDPWQQAAVRGKLLQAADATCATCKGGVDLEQARQSISLLAETIAGSCRQSAYLVRRFSRDFPAQILSYEDFMRLVLANYHVGSGCLIPSLKVVGSESSWKTISANFPTGCSSGTEYIRRIEEQIAP